MPLSRHVMRARRLAALCLAMGLASALAGCRNDVLQPTENRLRLEPTQMDFGTVYADGRTRRQQLTVHNDGVARLGVSWRLPEPPFVLVDPPGELQSGATELTLEFAPLVPGRYSASLDVSAEKAGKATLAIDAAAQPIPVCEPSSPCVEAHFDVDDGACVETTKPDGTGCDSGSACVVEATCQAGRCIGREKRCDDLNACTIDVCNAETGCEFLPRPPCPGDGRCQLGVCDPVKGCGLEAAPDGTTCGTLQTCRAAEVCISGECIVRDPPDGYLCAERSPCQGEGRCVANQCLRADAARPLAPSWTFDGTAADAGRYHDFVLEPSGAATLGGFFHSPGLLRGNTEQASLAPLGAARRCIVWSTRLVCADYPAAPNGHVTALDPATGATLWSYDVRTARPDFVRITQAIFMARLVVQGGDRLAALFEAYPLASQSGTQCRNYFLVILDAQGREVRAFQVREPLLDVCNHPHPYGVAADAVGNLFIAFSPSASQAAPLKPANPTLLMSFTHDGVFRWKLIEYQMTGGELAVARGLLYSENSEAVLLAATGQTAFLLPQTLGRVVVSDTRLIPAPVEGRSELASFEAGTASARWTHALPGPMRFWSDQIRLASWATSRGLRTVALTYVDDGSGLSSSLALRAINVKDGSEAFTCPLALSPPTPTQLFEVANGSLTMMAGALDDTGGRGCGKCDPPFAGSSATFWTVPLPGVGIAAEPWLGTFGGAGHDHREEVLGPGPSN